MEHSSNKPRSCVPKLPLSTSLKNLTSDHKKPEALSRKTRSVATQTPIEFLLAALDEFLTKDARRGGKLYNLAYCV